MRTTRTREHGVQALTSTATDPQAIRAKVHEFREKAVKAKLKAAATSEAVARKMFEDAARQFDDMADKLEETGRPY
jgi:hypothetical protein